MFCDQCGSKIPNGVSFCPQCGKQLGVRQPSQMRRDAAGVGQPVQMRRDAAGVDTVFSGLLYEKSRGAYWEFGIWVAVCVLAVLSLLAAVLVDGDSELRSDFRTFWIFLLIFTVGYGLLLTFRQRILAIYYSAVVFFFVLLIPYFNCERQIYSPFLDAADQDTPAILWVIYVFALLAAIALIVCLSVHIFSHFRLDLPVMILGVAMMSFVLLLGICTYVAPKQTYMSAFKESRLKGADAEWISERMEKESDKIKEWYGDASNGLGTTAYAVVCLASCAYLLLFFRGVMDNRKQNINLGRMLSQGQQWQGSYGGNAGEQSYAKMMPMSGPAVPEPAIRFLSGVYAGKTMGLQGDVIIGSAPGKAHVVIQDNMVSGQHCVIHFNRNTGNYEVRDLSKNGVYLQNGVRLQPGTYMACARGTVLYLGSRNQQICLM